MRLLDGITDSMDNEIVKDQEAWRAAVHEILKSLLQHQDSKLVAMERMN